MSDEFKKYLDLQEQLMQDSEYGGLLGEYRRQNGAFLAVLEQLDPRQRQVVEDYLGICAELHTKMLLLACRSKL